MTQRLTTAITTLWTNGRRIERIGYTVAIIAFVSGLTHLTINLLTGGTWTGPVSLRKPTTFGLSFGIVLATITWISTYIRLGPKLRHLIVGAFTLTSACEVTGITLQAWRGVPSHFNFTGTFSRGITVMLAAGGFILVACAITLAAASLRANPTVPPSMMLAVRAGLWIFLGAMATGAIMIATGTILTRTDSAQAAYHDAGWLKPSHAITMHAITVLPALSLVTSCMDRPESWRVKIAWLGTAAYLTAAAITIAANLILG
ncbi:MAG TPA: hypothetical protein VE172_18535 [Stackebrandtia sp.]|jgi:hypothetical protein|uniref:hypothetical protein n=1 Tax=Stackebrandtia sp. TaxID=2023065 RepID=UPI002D518CF3|nr:hypothetical protein [Stackebrandtia sp.]HZE40803.1 hypothetical protein [Stackebrandtia sp.]